MNLIHLVSEQTLQNLLPLLALCPARVIQIRSADERFAKAVENLKQAVAVLGRTPRYANFRPEFFELVIAEASPSLDSTRRKVGEALSLWPGAVVNLTGGTKLMSIGAWLSAAYQQESALYCDTQERRFVIEGKGRPPSLAPFEQVAASLTVEAMLAAAGLDPARIRFEQTPDAHHTFAAAAARAAEWMPWIAREAARFFDPASEKLVSKSRMREELTRPIGAVPESLSLAVAAAVGAGALWEGERGLFLSPNPATFTANSDRLLRAAEDNLRLLRGGWFELVVEQTLGGSGAFSDVRRGLATARETALGETDFVAFDPRAVCLVAISCKTADHHLRPLEHLSELHDRARRLGGTFARAALVLGRSDHAAKLGDLVAFARALRMSIYVGNPAEGPPRLAADDLPDHLHWKSAPLLSKR